MAQVAGAAQKGVIPITMMATPSYSGQFVVEGSPVKALMESGDFMYPLFLHLMQDKQRT